MTTPNDKLNPNGAIPGYSVGVPTGRIQVTHDFADANPFQFAAAVVGQKHHVRYMQINNTTVSPVVVTVSDGATVIWKDSVNTLASIPYTVDLAGTANTALNVTAAAGVTVNLQGATY